MFRKLANRLTSAVSGYNAEIRTLESMGFDPTQARSALEATGGNVDRAAELLLAGGITSSANIGDFSRSNMQDNDVALQNAMQESLQTEEQRLYQQAHEASLAATTTAHHTSNYQRSAANNKAAQAAMNRAAQANNQYGANKKTTTKKKQAKKTTSVNSTFATNNSNIRMHNYASNSTVSGIDTIAKHHPNVKVPTKLEDKSKEEQILRNVDRVKSHPSAVDTLYKALSALRNDPSNDKFRRIDKSSVGYQRSLASAPGAEALLLTMNFRSNPNNTLTIDRSNIDPALMYLGISALENAKKSNEYKEAKRQIQFKKEITNIKLSANSSEVEAVLRAGFISKCPTEPAMGRGALMQVTLGDEIVKRRFDGDDILQDILNWLGGHGSILPEKLLSREWCLIDKNQYPSNPIDCEANKKRTLQFVGFWPSGKLEIQPSPLSWSEGSDDDDEMMTDGSSRGLGAAPKSVL